MGLCSEKDGFSLACLWKSSYLFALKFSKQGLNFLLYGEANEKKYI